MKPYNSTNEAADLSALMPRLKHADTRYAMLCKIFPILYSVLIVVYIVIIIHDYFTEGLSKEDISTIFFILSMLSFVVLFRKLYKEYNYVDYSLPTVIMLKHAVKRYTPFSRFTAWALASVLLMDIGLSFESTDWHDLINIQIFFLGSICISILIGLMIWRVRYKPLRDEALRLIREIEEAE